MLIGYSSSTTLRQIPAFSLKHTQSWGLQPSYKQREKWNVLRKIFLLCPTPYPQTGPPQTIPHPSARRAEFVSGLAWGDGNRSNWTMHKWFSLFLYALYCRSHDLLVELISCLYSLFFLLIDFGRPAGVSQGEVNLLLCFQREWSWMHLLTQDPWTCLIHLIGFLFIGSRT